MRYPCLVLDHDDTVVNSTATVHYPCFVEYTARYFPEYHCTLDEYFLKNFDPGVVPFFRDEVGMSDEQMKHEQDYWLSYVQDHVPQAYDGIREILERYRAEGGIICVVSHSHADNILRDYRENRLPEPELIYGWERPPHERKPHPFPLRDIMRRLDLAPSQILMLDDLKPGYDMARACGVDFAGAGWSNDIKQIERFMRKNCHRYLKTVKELEEFLFAEEAET